MSTLRAEGLQPIHKRLLAEIDATDFSPVQKKVASDLRKQGIVVVQDWLDEGILALKQYYAIAILDPRNMHAVSDAVDPFWHAHILHTEAYMDFCDRAVGAYLHHDPLDHDHETRVGAVDRLYRYTTWCFKRFFNHVNLEFFPEELPQHRLVCLHQEVTYVKQLGQFGLLPARPEMQSAAVYAA